MAGGSTKQQPSAASRRARAEAARRAAQAEERRRRLLVIGGSALAAVVLVVALVFVAVSTRPAKAVTFPLPKDPAAAIAAAGLQLLPAEAEVVHIHAHLDVFVAGKEITVPGGIGIAEGRGISALHTHETDGIVHIESPVKRDYTLGELFTEWQVPLTSSCVGPTCGSVAVYVDGKRVQGDPKAVVLRAHQEVAVVAGAQPKRVPSSYDFPSGL